MSNISSTTTHYFHRVSAALSNPTHQETAQRVFSVALPFIALYKPLSFPISLGTGAVRTVAHISQLVSCINNKEDSKKIAYHALQTAVAVISVASTIFAHPLGMLITTAQDLVKEMSNLHECIQKGEYKKALESCAKILNNTLYLALLLDGGLKLSIAYLGTQVFLGIYHAQKEFRNDHYLEGAGHVAMTLIRCHQLVGQVQAWQQQSATETSSQKPAEEKRVRKPAEKATHHQPISQGASHVITETHIGSNPSDDYFITEDGSKWSHPWFQGHYVSNHYIEAKEHVVMMEVPNDLALQYQQQLSCNERPYHILVDSGSDASIMCVTFKLET